MSDLEKLLAAVERRSAVNSGQDIVQCTFLREILHDALGRPKETPAPAQPYFSQFAAQKEFPQWRIKYSADGQEIARRRVDSLEAFGELVREDGTWASATPSPIIERSN
jgi:hypothetical protein